MKSNKKEKSVRSGSVSIPRILEESEVAAPIVDEINAANDLKRLREQTRQALRAKYIEKSCTRLRFHYNNGDKKEVLIERAMESYADVQRAIASSHPRSQQLFMTQFENGERMSAETFRTCSIYRVKELPMPSIMPQYIPQVQTQWDFKQYSGAPPDWIDEREKKAKRLKELEEEMKKKQSLLVSTGDLLADIGSIV